MLIWQDSTGATQTRPGIIALGFGFGGSGLMVGKIRGATSRRQWNNLKTKLVTCKICKRFISGQGQVEGYEICAICMKKYRGKMGKTLNRKLGLRTL